MRESPGSQDHDPPVALLDGAADGGAEFHIALVGRRLTDSDGEHPVLPLRVQVMHQVQRGVVQGHPLIIRPLAAKPDLLSLLDDRFTEHLVAPVIVGQVVDRAGELVRRVEAGEMLRGVHDEAAGREPVGVEDDKGIEAGRLDALAVNLPERLGK